MMMVTGMEKPTTESVADAMLDVLPLLREKLIRPYEQETRNSLGLIQTRAIRILLQHEPMSMQELAAKVRISKQQLTPIMKKLMERGLVERASDPKDRRVVRIRMSQEGTRFAEEMRARIVQLLGRQIEDLKTEDLQLLDESLRNMLRIVHKLP